MYFYYLDDNHEQKGFFSIEQLKETGIKPDTLVWTEGLDDWKPAKEVEELKNLFISKPPPPPKTSIPSLPRKKRFWTKTKIVIFSVFLVLGIVTAVIFFIPEVRNTIKDLTGLNFDLIGRSGGSLSSSSSEKGVNSISFAEFNALKDGKKAKFRCYTMLGNSRYAEYYEIYIGNTKEKNALGKPRLEFVAYVSKNSTLGNTLFNS